MPYLLANKMYSTKTAVTKAAQSHIRAMRNLIIDSTHEHFLFFSDLFKFHPDSSYKLGTGLSRIHFRPCPRNWSNTTTYIERTDGTEMVISYLACMAPPPTPIANATEAMRSSINIYTAAYRGACSVYQCAFCSASDGLEVDHIYPFSKIRDDFLNQNVLKLPMRFARRHDEAKIFTPDDIEFETNWVTYHNTHAQYQMLCKQCNSQKGGRIHANVLGAPIKKIGVIDGSCFFGNIDSHN